MKSFALRPRHAAAVVLLAAALPFASAATANASPTFWGCSVDPETPYWHHINPANGNDVIRYDMTVTCAAGRTIEVEQHIHEADDINADDHITSNVRSRHFSTDDTVTMWWENTLPNTELGQEEMYHTVRFKVTLDDLSESPWTSFDASSEVKFSN